MQRFLSSSANDAIAIPWCLSSIFASRPLALDPTAHTMKRLLPLRLRLSLFTVQMATFAMLLRSVALDRWITFAASILLLVATIAAHRGRTWGVALSFTLGVTFAGVALLGIAPMWFSLVGILAARPFLRMLRHFVRFDRGATAVLATLAAGAGALGAVAWREYAFSLFQAFPSLRPSLHPHHGLVLLGMVVSAVVGSRLLRGPRVVEEATATTRIRIDEGVRVAGVTPADDAAALAELESELDPAAERRTLRVGS